MKKIRAHTAACIAFTALLSLCLWGIQLFHPVTSVPIAAYLGIACAIIAILLLAALSKEQQHDMDSLQKSHERELNACIQKHKEALANVQAQTRCEMEAFRNNLSHSLRMPVAIIQGYAELLASGVVKDEAAAIEYLKKINQRSQYMTEAISRQFSAADSMNNNKLTFSKLDLVALAEQAATDMRSAAEEKDIIIQVLSSQRQIFMEGDVYLLDRVLFNLLENAIKYIGRPGIITIRILQKGSQVSLMIQDDGLGLPTEETAHIFDANYQGSNHAAGQGYGLYLVRRAVEAHGGTISAQSAPGRGMGIMINLPLLAKE